jgi:hypothetical protein
MTASYNKSKKNTEIHVIRSSQISSRLYCICMYVWSH